MMSTGSMKPIALRAENLTEPVGVATSTPRFSWKLALNQEKRHNLYQSAYHIQVGTHAYGDNLWDSGVVKAATTFGVKYAGQPLPSGAKCWWQVEVYDQEGVSSGWSAPNSLSVGLLEPSDWSAKWIGYDAPRNAIAQEDPFAGASWIWGKSDKIGYFQKQFVLPEGFTTASLNITADDQFDLKINGQAISRSDGKIDAWRRPHTLDVTKFLKAGANEINVHADNTEGAAGLLVTLHVAYPNGTVALIQSDGDWQARIDPTQPFEPAVVVTAYGRGPWGMLGSHPLILPPPRLLRHNFEVAKEVTRATVYASALGLFELRLNGHAVSEDLFMPGWSDYSKRVYSRGYDVTSMMKSGENAIGVVLGDGWYSGFVGYDVHRDLYGTHTRALVQLELEFADGTKQTVVSGPDWRAGLGPMQSSDFLMGEDYNAQKEVPGWDTAGFDASSWVPVDLADQDMPSVEPFTGFPVRPFLELEAKTITEPKPGAFVIDLGQNIAGFARLRVNGKPGQKITLRFAERLNPDGTVYTANLRGAKATDTYTCKGGGEETWQPSFTFHGFQYIEVVGLGHQPKSGEVVGVAISSATPQAGTLETSDPMLNRLIHNAWWTQKMNFIDVPTDCPQRDERLGWTGDAQAYVRTATMLTDVQPFFTKWLVALDDGQRPDGQFPMVAPLKVSGDDGGPAWADAGVICPWTIFDVYGDRGLLERHYPAMRRFVEFCIARSTPELLPPKQFHCFGDWLSIDAPTPNEVIYSAYFAGSTRIVARAAQALGHIEDAQKYEALYQRLRLTFQKAYVSPAGVVRGETQCGYVLALAFDLLDRPEAKMAADHLVADIEKRGGHLSTGFVGTRDIMNVLSKVGRNDVAFRLLHNTTYPSWGFTIVNGATSIWERWDGWTPDKGFQDPGMNSFAHYAFGAVVGWIFAQPAGIDNLSHGFGEIRIAPQIDPKLTWLKSSYDSVRGKIVSSWSVSDGKLTMTVVVPPNVRAEIHVPARSVHGQPGMATPDAAGVYHVGSGEYTFTGTL